MVSCDRWCSPIIFSFSLSVVPFFILLFKRHSLFLQEKKIRHFSKIILLKISNFSFFLNQKHTLSLSLSNMSNVIDASATTSETAAQKVKTKSTSQSERAGLTFPIGRVARMLRDRSHVSRMQHMVPVHMACALESIVIDILDIAASQAHKCRVKRITPQHLTIALKSDRELTHVLARGSIAHGGVIPFVHSVLVPAMVKEAEEAKKAELKSKKNTKAAKSQASKRQKVSP